METIKGKIAIILGWVLVIAFVGSLTYGFGYFMGFRWEDQRIASERAEMARCDVEVSKSQKRVRDEIGMGVVDIAFQNYQQGQCMTFQKDDKAVQFCPYVLLEKPNK